jgi:CRP/FNR family cyclic AMP-dependent transcriptional regulator
MEGLQRIIKEYPFFAGMQDVFRELVCGCAKNTHFGAGQYLFHEGEPADWFYLIRHGRVAFQLTAPGRGAMTFQTVAEGELAGVSWLIPPYRWTYDAKAVEDTRAIAVNALCLRTAMIPYSIIKEVNPDEVKGSATGAINFLVFVMSAFAAPAFG